MDYPFVLTYRGFGDNDTFYIQGHVFRGMSMHNFEKEDTIWRNFVYMIKMFLVRTQPDVSVSLKGKGIKEQTVRTSETGLFSFKIEDHDLEEGWNELEVHLNDEIVEGQETVKAKAEVMIRNEFEYGIISDIDDTLLISHVTQPLKKFYLLMTKSSFSRKPVQGVVRFYRALCKGINPQFNPFFYVSSSEWNLYDFLIRFMDHNDFPKGVLQLKEIKDSWKDFLRSGYGSHDHKRIKIERILARYPEQKFILLGDNGQQDAEIYLSLARAFKDQVKAIYIRKATSSNTEKVNELLTEIDHLDVPTLQFEHVSEAMEHARKHQFI